MAMPPPPAGLPRPAGVPEPSAAAAAGAAAAALLQRQLAEDSAPKSGPTAWTEHQTGDGRKFFFHEELQTSTWEKPEVLLTPEERKNNTNWREYRIWDGRVFYHNHETKVSCWSMPPEIRRLRGESSGIDETPLPQTSAERRRVYWDALREHNVNDTWTWEKAEKATAGVAEVQLLPIEVRKQVFAELLGSCNADKLIEAREKQRNAAKALERLIEDRFGNPEDLGTTYEEAASLLEREEAWQQIKSDLRRDEVFQTVMERLEDKHQKARTEKRSEQAIRLQRLIATDAELKRPRLRWIDACAIMGKRDELHEEDPPLEALRVWASLRDIKPAAEHEQEAKRRILTEAAIRDERKRRDCFVEVLRDMAMKDSFSKDTAWPDLEGLVKDNPAFLGLREGPGATAMELCDEFQEELARGVALEEAGLGFEVDLAMPEGILVTDDGSRVVKTQVKSDLSSIKNEGVEPAMKRARLGLPPVPPPPPLAGMTRTKDEAMGAPKAAGMLAAKSEGQESSPLDQLLAAADAMQFSGSAAPANQLTKEELLDPSSKQPAAPKASAAAMVKEEVIEAPKRVAPKVLPGKPTAKAEEEAAAPAADASAEVAAAVNSAESFTAVQLMGKKVDDLRELCRTRGLQVSGRKQELVDRLVGGGS